MKLLGAFNHLHIFLDPNPDPEVSYQERVRLFEEVQGWGGYNTELISEGGENIFTLGKIHSTLKGSPKDAWSAHR